MKERVLQIALIPGWQESHGKARCLSIQNQDAGRIELLLLLRCLLREQGVTAAIATGPRSVRYWSKLATPVALSTITSSTSLEVADAHLEPLLPGEEYNTGREMLLYCIVNHMLNAGYILVETQEFREYDYVFSTPRTQNPVLNHVIALHNVSLTASGDEANVCVTPAVYRRGPLPIPIPANFEAISVHHVGGKMRVLRRVTREEDLLTTADRANRLRGFSLSMPDTAAKLSEHWRLRAGLTIPANKLPPMLQVQALDEEDQPRVCTASTAFDSRLAREAPGRSEVLPACLFADSWVYQASASRLSADDILTVFARVLQRASFAVTVNLRGAAATTTVAAGPFQTASSLKKQLQQKEKKRDGNESDDSLVLSDSDDDLLLA